jgi:hypothetical protein
MEDRLVPTNYSAATVSALVADINSANTAGGANTITLTAPTSSPYALTAVNNTTSGANGLPVIAANDKLTIVGNGDTIERSTAMPNFRLLEVHSNASLTLENVTLQGGFASGSGEGLGGAILNEGTLVLSAVTVQNNGCGVYVVENPYNLDLGSAYGSIAAGGGIWSSGFLTLENGTVIQRNDAQAGPGVSGGQTAGSGGAAFGGALYVAGGTLNISDTTFSSNRASGGAGGWSVGGTYGAAGNAYGGALYIAAGQVTLTASTLTGNSAIGGAGGAVPPVVYNPDAIPYTGPGGSAYGGALFVAGGTVTLSNDTVEGNSCQYGYQNDLSAGHGVASGGGIVIAQGATVSIDAFTLGHTINNALLPSSQRNPPQIVGKYIET